MAKKPAISPINRSKVTNGKTLFLPGFGEIDGRSVTARRFRDHVHALAEQVGGKPSAAQEMIIRRCAALAVICEQAEAKMVAGDAIDEAHFLGCAGRLASLLNTLGLHRHARDVSPEARIVDAHARAVLEESESE